MITPAICSLSTLFFIFRLALLYLSIFKFCYDKSENVPQVFIYLGLISYFKGANSLYITNNQWPTGRLGELVSWATKQKNSSLLHNPRDPVTGQLHQILFVIKCITSYARLILIFSLEAFLRRLFNLSLQSLDCSD